MVQSLIEGYWATRSTNAAPLRGSGYDGLYGCLRVISSAERAPRELHEKKESSRAIKPRSWRDCLARCGGGSLVLNCNAAAGVLNVDSLSQIFFSKEMLPFPMSSELLFPWFMGSLMTVFGLLIGFRFIHRRAMFMVDDVDEAPHEFELCLTCRMFFVWSTLYFCMTVASLWQPLVSVSLTWRNALISMSVLQGISIILWWRANVCWRPTVEKFYMGSVLFLNCLMAWGTARPCYFFFMLSATPVFVVMLLFMTSSPPFLIASSASSLFFVLLAEVGIIPQVAEPWISTDLLREAYENSVPIVLYITAIIFAAHLRYNLYLRNRKLSSYNGFKMQIINELAHEFRTPMNGIQGALQLIQNNVGDVVHSPFLDDQLSTLNFCSSVILILTKNVLMKEVHQKENLKIVDISAFMRGLMGVLEHLRYLKPKISLKLVIARDIPAILRLPVDSLTQVLLNLGSNAIKYQMEGEVVVSIDCEDDGKTLVFRFRDQGCGISSKFMESGIFQAFKRDPLASGSVN